MKASCETCKFYTPGSDQPRNADMYRDEAGECRRRSPRGGSFAVYLQRAKEPKRVSTVMFPFPPVHSSDWCGEFEVMEKTP